MEATFPTFVHVGLRCFVDVIHLLEEASFQPAFVIPQDPRIVREALASLRRLVTICPHPPPDLVDLSDMQVIIIVTDVYIQPIYMYISIIPDLI